MADRKITADVLTFLDTASSRYGRMQAERFSQSMYCAMVEMGLESPIEDLFYVAAHLMCESQFVEVDPAPILTPDGQQLASTGVCITPQAQIGPYRVDFLISQRDLSDDQTSVVVELDGHDFHDKDKYQRAYEKARDRYLVKEKYRVLHFTGSEVVADPFRVAYEVLQLVGVFGCDPPKYDPNNPLGTE